MVSAERTAANRFSAVHRSAAQHRVLDAALTLIADHGVGGTSLQMIADEVGVTKAAVYHQFKTKEEIVIALTERELGRLTKRWRPPRPNSPGRGPVKCFSAA